MEENDLKVICGPLWRGGGRWGVSALAEAWASGVCSCLPFLVGSSSRAGRWAPFEVGLLFAIDVM